MKKLLGLTVIAMLAAALAAPSAADAKTKRKRVVVKQQPQYEVNAQGYNCQRGFAGIDCSNVYANTPDPALNAQIISDFRRGLYGPSNR